MPYVFLSKKDGSIISRVNLSFSKRNSNTLVTYKGNDGMNSVTINTPHKNVKFGQEFIIADMSTDTVFLLSQDKILKPIFVRKPSVFNNDMQQYVMVVHFKTNKYLFFLTYLLDWNEVKRQTERGERYRPSIQHFGYDLQTGEVFTPVGRYDVALSMDVPENTFVMKHSADIFIERFGKIIRDGKLKQVTQPLKEEDNHVIQIIKYK